MDIKENSAMEMPDRFWSKVDKTDECWIWNAGKDKYGYGLFKLNKKMVLAHRLSFSCAVRNIEPAEQVLHACDNPSCVNPKHMSLGNPLLNARDRESKHRGRKGRKFPNECHNQSRESN